MSLVKRTGRTARVALVFLILALAGCQSQVATPAGMDPPESASSVTLALLGDVMLGRDVHPTPETFAYLEPSLASADLALANLESPLTISPVETKSPYVLCAPPEHVRYLVEAGFDLLALANNHSLDCGTEGQLETQRTLADAGLDFIGPNAEPIFRSIHGIQLAFVAFDAISGFDVEAGLQAVRSARQAGAVVIVSVHWGTEYQAGPSSSQEQLAGGLAEAGATLIWGHHPHVLQPAAWINEGKTLVFYSLGNALFDQYGLAATRRSALALVRLDRDGLQEFDVVPFLIDVEASRIRKAGPADAERILQYFQ